MARAEADALTADGRSQLLTVSNTPRGGGASLIKTVFVVGTFGGGTATLQVTEDGTNHADVLDQSGSAVTFTANKACNIEVASDPLQPVFLSINLAGATSPNIRLVVFDAA